MYTLITGKYADKIKENELILVLGYILMGIGFALYITVSSVIMLLFVQLVIGFAEAIYAPAFDALYTNILLKVREEEDGVPGRQPTISSLQ